MARTSAQRTRPPHPKAEAIKRLKEHKAAYDTAKADILRIMSLHSVDSAFTESSSGNLVVSARTEEWTFKAAHIESVRWDLERLEKDHPEDHPELVKEYKTATIHTDRVKVEPFVSQMAAKEVA